MRVRAKHKENTFERIRLLFWLSWTLSKKKSILLWPITPPIENPLLQIKGTGKDNRKNEPHLQLQKIDIYNKWVQKEYRESLHAKDNENPNDIYILNIQWLIWELESTGCTSRSKDSASYRVGDIEGLIQIRSAIDEDSKEKCKSKSRHRKPNQASSKLSWCYAS